MGDFFKQDISKRIFEMKYMIHGEKDEDQVFKEIAEEIGNNEEEINIFYSEIKQGRLIPGGRILANARPYSKLKNYINCFVIDIEDSMESITNALSEYMKILKQGGGVGFNISKLRPKGAELSVGGKSSGPLSFLEVFDQASKTIEVGGARRGASICILDVSHPDIEEFIEFKQGDDNKKLTQFNISVGVTDEFMNAVSSNMDWDLRWNGRVFKTVKAKILYDKIMRNAYLYNEPGIFNFSIVNKYNNGYYLYEIKSPNPCGEIPLSPYGVCCLSSINLTQFVVKSFESDASIDWSLLKKSIMTGIRFLDNVVDKSEYPFKKIENRAKGDRRIGLGVTGLGDALAMLRLSYDSKDAEKFIARLFQFFRDVSYKASIELAKERGTFPNYDKKFLESEFIKNLPVDVRADIRKYGIRNICLNSNAPTGTISLTVGQNCSSGIEPIFSLEYDRIVQVDNEDKIERIYDYAWLLYREKFGGEEIPDFFKTALQIDPYRHVDIQAVIQKYVDNSISKTINIPENYSRKDYSNLFYYAYKKEVKGVTSFRVGSMKGVLNVINGKDGNRPLYICRTYAPKRPPELPCDIYEISVDKIRHIVLVGKLHGTLYEIFVTNDPENKIEKIGKKTGIIRKVKKNHYQLSIDNGNEKICIDNIGKEFDEEYSSLSRFISMSLRHGVPLQFIVDQLQKDKNFVGFERSVARILKKYIKEGEKVLTDKCRECGKDLVYKEGCVQCVSCGWSKCS